MLNKIKQSLAFRSGPVYQKLCSFLPDPEYRTGPSCHFRLLSMTGKKHLDMLNQSLISLHNTWNKRPDLIIYSDGSVTIQALQKKLGWWKGNIKYGTQEDILAWTQQCGSSALHSFAEKEAVGRKLSCILLESEAAPVLWCDTDILWYKELSLSSPGAGLHIQVSEDYQSAYDGFISQKAAGILTAPPYINTGLVYLSGTLVSNPQLSMWLDLVGQQPNHFTEQTFLALAVKLLQGNRWTLNEIACLQSDRFDLSPSYTGKPWYARHYVGPVRHLFWRDSFFSRLLKSS